MINQNKYLVADLIADWLEKNNIQIVFGIIGSANSYIFDSISKKGFTRIVYMHHEQSVAQINEEEQGNTPRMRHFEI